MNKASRGDGIPAVLSQILKDDAVKILHPICQQIWKTQQWPQDWKKSVFIPIPKKGNAKECSNYHTIAHISYANKIMLKILQVRLQQYVNQEFPDVQGGFRKGRGTRDQIANICWLIKKANEFQKNIYFCFIDYAKAFGPCGSQQMVENYSREHCQFVKQHRSTHLNKISALIASQSQFCKSRAKTLENISVVMIHGCMWQEWEYQPT